MAKKKVRLSLDITEESNEILEQMAGAIGGTKSDVLRRALAIMEVAVQAKKKGSKFGIAEKGQVLATEIVGL